MYCYNLLQHSSNIHVSQQYAVFDLSQLNKFSLAKFRPRLSNYCQVKIVKSRDVQYHILTIMLPHLYGSTETYLLYLVYEGDADQLILFMTFIPCEHRCVGNTCIFIRDACSLVTYTFATISMATNRKCDQESKMILSKTYRDKGVTV